MEEFEDVLIGLSLKNLDAENKRYRDLDNKAISIITISGILISFLVGFVNSSEMIGSKILFTMTTLVFLSAVFCSVLVLRIRMTDILTTRCLIDKLKDKKQERQIRGILGTIAKVEDSLQTVCNTKANELRYSVYLLGIGVMFLILYSISTVFPTITAFKDYIFGLF